MDKTELMDKAELAEKLDGIEYPVRISDEIKKVAKDNNLVIVYGASDDLVEFDGAIYDEIGCYGGGTVLLDSLGVLPEREQIENDDELKLFFQREPHAKKINAIWCGDEGYSWTYTTDIPHRTFNVMEDGEIYCRGIVFSLSGD